MLQRADAHVAQAKGDLADSIRRWRTATAQLRMSVRRGGTAPPHPAARRVIEAARTSLSLVQQAEAAKDRIQAARWKQELAAGRALAAAVRMRPHPRQPCAARPRGARAEAPCPDASGPLPRSPPACITSAASPRSQRGAGGTQSPLPGAEGPQQQARHVAPLAKSVSLGAPGPA